MAARGLTNSRSRGAQDASTVPLRRLSGNGLCIGLVVLQSPGACYEQKRIVFPWRAERSCVILAGGLIARRQGSPSRSHQKISEATFPEAIAALARARLENETEAGSRRKEL